MPDVTFHCLRHEGISRLFEKGYSIPQVAVHSGHKNWNNLRRYTHLLQKTPPDCNYLVKPYRLLIPKGYREMNFSSAWLQPLITGKIEWDHQIVTPDLFSACMKLEKAYLAQIADQCKVEE